LWSTEYRPEEAVMVPMGQDVLAGFGSLPQATKVVIDTALGDGGEAVKPERVGYAEAFSILVEGDVNVKFIVLHFFLDNSNINAIYVAMAEFFKDEEIPGGYVQNEGGPESDEQRLFDF
jgi:hypothetical protein